MLNVLRGGVLLMGALATAQAGVGQQLAHPMQRPAFDLAITYTAERAKIASVDCGCFWLQGGSFSGAATFFHGAGVAVNLSGSHAANVQSAVTLSKVTFLAGPRYTFRPTRWNQEHFGGRHPVSLFTEMLFGTVHGFDAIFPGVSETRTSANSFAYQLGGGFDWQFARGFGVRPLEADYVRSTLPNNGSNTQNDLRLSGGITFHTR